MNTQKIITPIFLGLAVVLLALGFLQPVAADGSDITRVPVFGRICGVNQNLSTTDTITITLNAVGR